jgi:hypothetical protein
MLNRHSLQFQREALTQKIAHALSQAAFEVSEQEFS